MIKLSIFKLFPKSELLHFFIISMDQSGPIYFIFSFFKIKKKGKSRKEFPNPTQNVCLDAVQSFNTAPGFPQFEQHSAKGAPLRG